VNIGKKEARHLLDALIYLRKAVVIVRTQQDEVSSVEQLALERCIEIADEAFQRAEPLPLGDVEESLRLGLSRLRQQISREYDFVEPRALRKTVLTDFPRLIGKLELLEDELLKIAKIKRPPAL
jgi:uncharacterized protein with HEPN domain